MSRPSMMVLRPQSATDSDYELDWSYTLRCTKEWSGDELLSHLCSKAFTIPPRDYNPSAPFVYVRTEDGVITTLPHGYRIPLMFVAKYQWETIFRTLSLQNRQHWEAVRDEIFHLSRLCHALFSKARAKAESGGMEKGWRCVMFDRVLTRFYKGWPVCSPAKLEAFVSHFSSKEYDRDVLKNDWKRWALKGFFRPPSSSPSIHLTEDDVSNGITAVDFIMRLSKIDNVWTLSTKTKNNSVKRRPIKFLQPTEGSSSELTDFDLSLDEDDEGDGDIENTNLDMHPPSLVEAPTKRCREPSEDDDTRNRSGKRAKLEEIIRSISSLPCSPRPLGSEDVVDELHDALPKFKVPRQILLSYGWKPLSATDGLTRRRQREGEEESRTGTEVLPACGYDSPSISTPPSSEPTPSILPATYPFDYPPSKANSSNSSSIRPYNDVPRSVLQANGQPTSPNLTPISSKSKGKQPESASTDSTTTSNTFRHPRNNVHVSLPSSSSRVMKPRTGPPATIPPPPSPTPPVTRGRGGGGGVGKGTDPSRDSVPPLPSPSPSLSEVQSSLLVVMDESGRLFDHDNCCVESTQDAGRDGTEGGGDGDVDVNSRKEGNATDVEGEEEEKIAAGVHQDSGLSSSSSASPSIITTSSDTEVNNECGERGATTSTASPVPPGLEPMPSLPEPIRSTSYPISFASSSSLSPLSSSVTPSPSGPLVSNSGGGDGGGCVGGVDVVVDVGCGTTQQVKDRIRELKTRFLSFKEDLERIIARLEVLEGGEDGDGDLLGQGIGRSSTKDHPNFVVSQTEDKRKRKDNESDRDIEMMVESGGAKIPGYVDAAVGLYADALVALRDVSVQTVDDVSSAAATLLHSTDDFSDVMKKNLGKIKPNTLSKTDESVVQPPLPPTQFVNAASLSTMVDNLVSIKMLSMMQTLVKSSIGGNSNGKTKLADPSATTKPDSSDNPICHQPSPSSSSSSSSSSLSISAAAGHSVDACNSIIMSSLLDELKTIKQEARCREQSEKEDLLAMRQLHSAEVDALRRRLSYLESRDLSLGRWDSSLSNGVGVGASGRGWKDSNSSRVDESLELDRRHRLHRFFEDSGTRHSFRQQQQQQQHRGDRPSSHHHQPFQVRENGLTHYSSGSTSSIVNPEGASTSSTRTNATATATATTNTTTNTATTTTPLSSRNPNNSSPLPPLSITSSTAMGDDSAAMISPSLPTPTPSDKHYSFGVSKKNGGGDDNNNGYNNHYYHGMGMAQRGMGMGMDLDNDDGGGMVNNLPLPISLPLPIKSQRKHHIMALARAHFY